MSNPSQKRARRRGFSIVELMVAIVISMMLMAVIASVLVSAEGNKRSMTNVNDIDQAGNYAAYVLDGWIRGAGSGFDQSANYSLGCPLKYGAILPATALPTPFADMNATVRLIPVLIGPDKTTPSVSGSTSDVLVVMQGASGGANAMAQLTSAASSTALALKTTLGFNVNDLVLLADQPGTSAMADCTIAKVTAPTTGGSSYTSLGISTSVALTSNAVVMNLGNITNGNPPNFMMVGVGDNDTLYGYDLLQTTGSTVSVPIADGVFEMHALYGVDTTASGNVTAWASPSSGTYSYTALTAGTSTAAGLLENIKAIRIGLIMRSPLQEKSQSAPAAASSSSITLFSGVTDASGNDISYTRTFTGDEKLYRYRKIDVTIPLRNNRLL
jgi:type IV pilus assembly protein PilW